jgi:hypothetical protein
MSSAIVPTFTSVEPINVRRNAAFVLDEHQVFRAGAEPPSSTRQSEGSGQSNGIIVSAAAAAHSNRADDRSVAPQRDAASEDHHTPVVGNMNSKKLLARLAVCGELGGRDIECARGNALLIEISILPSHAPSILMWLTKFPPASTTAMFIGCPISRAFFSAAEMTRRASSNVIIGSFTLR